MCQITLESFTYSSRMDPRISFHPTTISGMHLGSCREQPSPQQVRPNLLLMGKIVRQNSLGRRPRCWSLKRTLHWIAKTCSWQINPVRSDEKLNTWKEDLKCLLGIYPCATYFSKIWVRCCILASLQGAKSSWSFLEFWWRWQKPGFCITASFSVHYMGSTGGICSVPAGHSRMLHARNSARTEGGEGGFLLLLAWLFNFFGWSS